MNPTHVTVVIEYRALPGQAERALAELDRLVEIVVREEADCFGIEVLRDATDPERLLLVEQWSSEEAYLGPHFETPHLQEFIVLARTLFTGPPTIGYWRLQATHARG
jgi:quinol monooxygenase YgiN